MLKRHSQLFEGLFTASDLLVVSLAWTVSYWIRFSSGYIPIDKGIPPFTDYLKMLIFVWPIWAYVFRRSGMYRPMRARSRFPELGNLLRANALSVLLLMSVTYLFREKSVPFSRAVFVIFGITSSIVIIGSRGMVRLFLREMRRRGYNLRYAVIVGAGDLARKIARRMLTHPEFGIELMGCLANDREISRVMHRLDAYQVGHRMELRVAQAGSRTTAVSVEGAGPVEVEGRLEIKSGEVFARSGGPEVEAGSPALVPPGGYWSPNRLPALESVPAPQQVAASRKFRSRFRVIGTYSDIPALIDQGGIDQIIVALPLRDHDKLESVIASIGDAMIDVRIVPDFHQFIQLGSQVEDFDGVPVVSLASTPLSGINRVTKRIFDLVVGTALFLISIPIIALCILLIKFSSRGPAFFTQERVGLDGKRFKIFKLRTMSLDAEKDGAKFAVKGDPRVTLVGRILRRLSIDELPQLINVILGQMSLVGPRPERPVFIEEFRRHFPRYMLRHKVQAGMTGWAQVNGWRGNTSIERRIEHDLFYIENWSLLLDVKILARTVLATIFDRNAY